MTRKSLPYFIFALLVVLLFGRTLGYEFVNWDDSLYVFSRRVTHWTTYSWFERLTTPHLGYPAPLPIAIYAFIFEFFGMEGATFHFTNLLFHFLNCSLLFYFIRKLEFSFFISLFVVVFWGFHPLVVEPVSWASGLKEILVLTGILIGLCGAQRVLEQDDSFGAWIPIFLGFSLAIASKPTGVALGPLLIVLATSHILQRLEMEGDGSCFGGFSQITVTGLVLCLFSLLYGYWVYLSNKAQGGHDVLGALWERVFAALYIQLKHVVFPIDLSPWYAFSSPSWGAYATVLAGFLVLIFVGSWISRMRAVYLFGMSWFAVTYLPVSNVIPLSRFTSDSYMYIPLIGAIILIGVCLQNLDVSKRGKKILALGCLIPYLGVASIQVNIWKNSVFLWERVQQEYSDSAFVYLKLGQAYYKFGEYRTAIKTFEKASSAYGRQIPFPKRWGMAYCNLGYLTRCESIFIEGVKRLSRNPVFGRFRQNRHSVLREYSEVLRQIGKAPADSLSEETKEILRKVMEERQTAGGLYNEIENR